MAVAVADPEAPQKPRRERKPRDPNRPRAERSPGVSIALSEEQRKAVREMARASGVKASAYVTQALSPAIDAMISDFEANREVIAARARALAAKNAAARAAELAAQAQAELDALETGQ